MAKRRRGAGSPSKPSPIRSYPITFADTFRALGPAAGGLWRWNVAYPIRLGMEWEAMRTALDRLQAVTPYRWQGDLLIIDTFAGPVAVAHYSEFPRASAAAG